MADVFEKKKRSEIMSRIRAKDTKPEMIVRRSLHKAGYRFSLYNKDLPGKPDILLRKYHAAVFVQGCFWHQHPGCRRCTKPKTNEAYWIPKLKRNVERFEHVCRQLNELGWNVVVVWECETKKPAELVSRIRQLVGKDD